MTVVVAAASPEGVVLAADSRTTRIRGQHHRVSTDSAKKVFGVCDRYGVATYGAAFIEEKTVHGVMDEFIAQMDPAPDEVGRFAQELGQFFHDRLTQALEAAGQTWQGPGWPLGFLVAGYDETGIGHVYELGIPGPSISATTVDTVKLGLMWRGQTDVIRRLIKGIDWDGLGAAGVTIEDEVAKHLRGLEYSLIFPITLRDAVDCASFLIRTTIEMQRFSDGTFGSPTLVPACGGSFQALAVTRSGTEWVSEMGGLSSQA